VLLEALSLNHGEGYGRSFFTRVSRRELTQIFRDETRPEPKSIKELYQRIEQKKGKSKNSEELLAALEGLIDYPQLFTTEEQERENPESIIDFERALERNQVVYFWLPALTQTISVQEIGKLALFCLFIAAIERTEKRQKKQCYLIIDEFQRIVGRNLAGLLEQARSFGIAAILANQNLSQLKTPDLDLEDLVISNVAFSMHFGSADPKEKRLLSEASGEVLELLRSVTETVGFATGLAISNTTGESRSETETHSSADGKGYSTGSSSQDSAGHSYFSGSSYEPDIFGGVTTVNYSSGHTDSRQHTRGKSQSETSTSSSGVSHGHTSGRSETHGTTESNSSSQSSSMTAEEVFRPRISLEEIGAIFSKQNMFISWPRRGGGLADTEGIPIAIQGLYPLDRFVYERRQKALWPDLPGKIAVAAEARRLERMKNPSLLIKQVNENFTDET
jgi:hypothetical protein